MSEKLLEVLAANKARQDRARQLNIRAGAEMFPVLDQAQMRAWMTDKAAGARRMAEIADPEALRLPALDEVLVQTVIRENPDEIELLGAMRTVDYKDSYGRSRPNPRVRIDFRGENANDWQRLPDEIRLPGGREVCLYSAIDGYGYYIEAVPSEFKAKVRDCLNQAQWDNWPQADRPEIPVLDPADDEAAIPEITTVQYGQCVVTGEPLIAFGTLAPKSRYYTTDPYFVVQWYRSIEEAEVSRVKAVETLEKELAAVRECRELEIAKQEAEAVKLIFESLYREVDNTREWLELPDELRNRLRSRHCSYVPSSLLEIRQWQAETEALIAEVGPALVEIKRQQAEAERQAREEQEAAVRAEEARRVREEEAHRGQMEEILTAMRGVLGYVPVIRCDFEEVAGKNGTYLENWGRLTGINCDGESDSYCDGRNAVVVQSVETTGGVLEFLAYWKYGNWNLAARWRELSEAAAHAVEIGEVRAEDLEDPKPVEDLGASLAALQAKFKGLN